LSRPRAVPSPTLMANKCQFACSCIWHSYGQPATPFPIERRPQLASPQAVGRPLMSNFRAAANGRFHRGVLFTRFNMANEPAFIGVRFPVASPSRAELVVTVSRNRTSVSGSSAQRESLTPRRQNFTSTVLVVLPRGNHLRALFSACCIRLFFLLFWCVNRPVLARQCWSMACILSDLPSIACGGGLRIVLVNLQNPRE